MKKIWIIANRELASYFDSLIAYVMIILFLGMSGFFTWLFGSCHRTEMVLEIETAVRSGSIVLHHPKVQRIQAER